MAGYNNDRFATRFEKVVALVNQEDDVVGTDENTPEDMFFALGEEHAGADSVELATYDPSTFAWATGGDTTTLTVTVATWATATHSGTIELT